MKFTVLGMGKTGHSASCYLRNLGLDVTCWDRNADKLKVIAANGIEIEGALSGHFDVKCEEDIALAVKDADYILVNTVANAHSDVANLLSGKLKEGQRIILFNSNWGIYEFMTVIGAEIEEKRIALLETGGMHLMTDLMVVGKCRLKKIKKTLNATVYPTCKSDCVFSELAPVFPQFKPVKSIMLTSMNATNPILHAPIALCGFSKIEGGVDHFFYKEGGTPHVVSYIEKIDNERLAVMDAMKVKGDSCLEIVNAAWGSDYDNLYDAIQNNYLTSKGPRSIEYRFITEDIPYGICPISKLGKLYGVATPYVDTLIDIYEKLMNRSFMDECPAFDKALLEKVAGI